MKKFIIIPSLLLTLSLMFTGCKKGETGMQFEVGINKGSSMLKTARVTASDYLHFHSGHVIISEIDFEGDLTGDKAGPVEFKIEQRTKIDFATGIATPPLAPIVLEAGTYNEPSLSIELYDGDTEPALVVEGDYTHTNSNVIPIRFSFDDFDEFEAEAETHTFMEDVEAIATYTLDPQFWFNTVPRNLLDNAVIGTDGYITVSESENTDIYEIALDRLEINSETEFR